MVSKTCLVLLLAVVCLQAAGGATAAGGTKVDGPDDGKHQSIGRCEGVSLGYTVGDAKTKSHRCCWSEENENKAGVDVGLGSTAAVKTFSDAQDVCGDAAAAPLHDLKDLEDEEKFAAAMTTFIKGCEGTDGCMVCKSSNLGSFCAASRKKEAPCGERFDNEIIFYGDGKCEDITLEKQLGPCEGFMGKCCGSTDKKHGFKSRTNVAALKKWTDHLGLCLEIQLNFGDVKHSYQHLKDTCKKKGPTCQICGEKSLHVTDPDGPEKALGNGFGGNFCGPRAATKDDECRVRVGDVVTFFGKNVCFSSEKEHQPSKCEGIHNASERCCSKIGDFDRLDKDGKPVIDKAGKKVKFDFDTEFDRCFSVDTSGIEKMETACDKAGCLWCEGGGVQEGVGFCGPKATCEYRHDNIIVSLTKDKCAYHYVHANDGACAQIGKDCCDDSEEFLKDENDCYDLDIDYDDKGDLKVKSRAVMRGECDAKGKDKCMLCNIEGRATCSPVPAKKCSVKIGQNHVVQYDPGTRKCTTSLLDVAPGACSGVNGKCCEKDEKNFSEKANFCGDLLWNFDEKKGEEDAARMTRLDVEKKAFAATCNNKQDKDKKNACSFCDSDYFQQGDGITIGGYCAPIVEHHCESRDGNLITTLFAKKGEKSCEPEDKECKPTFARDVKMCKVRPVVVPGGQCDGIPKPTPVKVVVKGKTVTQMSTPAPCCAGFADFDAKLKKCGGIVTDAAGETKCAATAGCSILALPKPLKGKACLPTDAQECAFRDENVIYTVGKKLSAKAYVDNASFCYGIDDDALCCDTQPDFAANFSQCYSTGVDAETPVARADACNLNKKCAYCGNPGAPTNYDHCAPKRVGSMDKKKNPLAQNLPCQDQVDGIVTAYSDTCKTHYAGVPSKPEESGGASFMIYIIIAGAAAGLIFLVIFIRARGASAAEKNLTLLNDYASGDV